MNGAVAAPGVTFTPTLTVQVAPPDLLCQTNVEAVTGITPRVFLRELVPLFRAAGGDVAERGKLRLVRRESFIAWLMSSRAEPRTSPAKKPDGADELALELGLRVVDGGRRHG